MTLVSTTPPFANPQQREREHAQTRINACASLVCSALVFVQVAFECALTAASTYVRQCAANIALGQVALETKHTRSTHMHARTQEQRNGALRNKGGISQEQNSSSSSSSRVVRQIFGGG